MSAAVEAHEVGRRYGPVTAVEDLTFAVEAGEILGVLGPNGAGKTTALRVLTTILAPTWGTFTVGGIPSSRPTDVRRRIGVLPESGGYRSVRRARSTCATTPACSGRAGWAAGRSPKSCWARSVCTKAGVP
jgi:ABC-type multidrug transport system ATPase subunit